MVAYEIQPSDRRPKGHTYGQSSRTNNEVSILETIFNIWVPNQRI